MNAATVYNAMYEYGYNAPDEYEYNQANYADNPSHLLVTIPDRGLKFHNAKEDKKTYMKEWYYCYD